MFEPDDQLAVTFSTEATSPSSMDLHGLKWAMRCSRYLPKPWSFWLFSVWYEPSHILVVSFTWVVLHEAAARKWMFWLCLQHGLLSNIAVVSIRCL